jgi:hypothetical protein
VSPVALSVIRNVHVPFPVRPANTGSIAVGVFEPTPIVRYSPGATTPPTCPTATS